MANLITLSRFPLLILTVVLLYADHPLLRLLSAGLLGLLILLDSVDGIVARTRHEVSLVGSVMDIMADRAVELVMWIVYADLNLIPVAIPIIFVLRGTVVDSLRSLHVRDGKAPFKSMRTKVGRWLVGSPWMRTSYGMIKFLSFAGLAVGHALCAYAARGVVAQSHTDLILLVSRALSWVSVAFCLIRGLPVIAEALRDRASLGETAES